MLKIKSLKTREENKEKQILRKDYKGEEKRTRTRETEIEDVNRMSKRDEETLKMLRDKTARHEPKKKKNKSGREIEKRQRKTRVKEKLKR